jgi:hypothetical protein
MEFNGVLVLAVVWILVSLLGKLGQKQQPKDQRRRVPRTGPPSNTPPLPQGPSAQDATQREGTRLELVLRELQRSLEEANEEQESLEVEPEVRSLEEDFRREVRRTVDQDEGAEQIEARRIKAAADRDAPRVKADHVQFDKRIREEPADHTATQRYTARQLRDAVVWREILGPPASMRDEH